MEQYVRDQPVKHDYIVAGDPIILPISLQDFHTLFFDGTHFLDGMLGDVGHEVTKTYDWKRHDEFNAKK